MNVVLGLGHDVVALGAFAEQCAQPGSRIRALFSTRELRQAAVLARVRHDDQARHLAVRWAGKEAVIKAWSQALDQRPSPYAIDGVPWACIEILDDSRGRPYVVLADDVARTLAASVAHDGDLRWLLSLSHDGPVASAVCLLEAPIARVGPECG